jgi:hypothetical protein
LSHSKAMNSDRPVQSRKKTYKISGKTNHGNLHHSNDHFIAAYVQLLYKRLGREAPRAVGVHHSNDHFKAAYVQLLCNRLGRDALLAQGLPQRQQSVSGLGYPPNKFSVIQAKNL